MAQVTLTSAVAGQVATAAFYNNNNNALLNQINGNLDDTNLAALSVGATQLKTGAVTGTKIAMGSDAQGDILIRGAANYQRLAAGTSGQFLMTQGSSSNPKWDYGNLMQFVYSESGAVATGTTNLPIDDTIPQNTEGDQYLTCTITPKSATSRLKIDIVWNGANDSTGTFGVALFQDATAGALAALAHKVTGNENFQICFSHIMTSGTTSATTFNVRAGFNTGGNTTTFNGNSTSRLLGGVMASSISITEIK